MDLQAASPMVVEECEISYQTSGTQAFGGLDRGRLLSAMDAEVLKMLAPYCAPKLDYSVTPPTAMLTQVFWEEPVFGPIAAQREQLARSAKVKVYWYVEEEKR